MTPILLTLVFSFGIQAPTPALPTATLGEVYYWFLQGRMLEESGDVQGAVAALRQAIDRAPTSAPLRAELAGLFAREGRPNEAIAEADAALAIDPANREAHRILGLVKAALAERSLSAGTAGAGPDAIAHLEKAIAGGVRDLGVELTLGRLYVRSGQHAKGIDRLRRFLADQPEHVDALMLLADAYEDSGQPAAAVSALESAAAGGSAPPQVFMRLGELYENGSRWKEAASIWRALARATPQRSTPFRIRYATALVNSGDLAAGRQELVDLTAAAPRDISVWYMLSQVERRLGNAAAAEEAAARIAEIDPRDARGPLALAQAHAARGNYRGVIETLEPRVKEARDQDIAAGTYARMAGDLALAFQEVGERSRAIELLEGARRRDPDTLSVLFALAAAYERGSRFDEAERAFRDLLARDPEHAGALNYLGYMLADRGQKLDEALALVQRALAIEADNPSYLDSLGWAYFKLARLDDARGPLERAASALPKTSVIQDHLGDVYFELKRFKDAVVAFDRALAGDREGIDAAAVTRKRDRARQLADRN
jgi:tetratricopeptide (TPR) repeat protein